MEQDGYKIAVPQAPQRLTRGEQNNAAPQAPPGKTREQEMHVLHCVMRQPGLCCAVRHFLLCFIALYSGSIMISVLLFERSSSGLLKGVADTTLFCRVSEAVCCTLPTPPSMGSDAARESPNQGVEAVQSMPLRPGIGREGMRMPNREPCRKHTREARRTSPQKKVPAPGAERRMTNPFFDTCAALVHSIRITQSQDASTETAPDSRCTVASLKQYLGQQKNTPSGDDEEFAPHHSPPPPGMRPLHWGHYDVVRTLRPPRKGRRPRAECDRDARNRWAARAGMGGWVARCGGGGGRGFSGFSGRIPARKSAPRAARPPPPAAARARGGGRMGREFILGVRLAETPDQTTARCIRPQIRHFGSGTTYRIMISQVPACLGTPLIVFLASGVWSGRGVASYTLVEEQHHTIAGAMTWTVEDGHGDFLARRRRARVVRLATIHKVALLRPHPLSSAVREKRPRPRPVRVRFFKFYCAPRVRSASAAVFPSELEHPVNNELHLVVPTPPPV
eukprot:gene12208-biopygen4917